MKKDEEQKDSQEPTQKSTEEGIERIRNSPPEPGSYRKPAGPAPVLPLRFFGPRTIFGKVPTKNDIPIEPLTKEDLERIRNYPPDQAF